MSSFLSTLFARATAPFSRKGRDRQPAKTEYFRFLIENPETGTGIYVESYDFFFPPGGLIAEELAARQLTKKHLADSLGWDENRVNCLLAGHLHVDPKIAALLEEYFGISAGFWLNKEARFRTGLEACARFHNVFEGGRDE